MTMTLDERERRAYADGDTALAALLQEAQDGDGELVSKAWADGYALGQNDERVAWEND